MYSLYPMKFNPILKYRIWGGHKIQKNFGFNEKDMDKCGEAWVLSGVKGSESIVSNGHFAGNTLLEMSEIFMDDMLGEELYKKHNDEFPVLLKIIDADDFLSVQVHPDDAMAKVKHNMRNGKSEMWYIIHAEPGAQIVAGFNQPMNKDKLLKHIENATIKDILKFHSVNSGDMIYIPAGMVHATGPGILMAEIQQTSDITYRLYDWNRTDEQGKSRELHISDALDAIDFELKPNLIKGFNPKVNQTTPMINTPFFRTSFVKLHATVEKNIELVDSCVIYLALSGCFEVQSENDTIRVNAGECILIPACLDNFILLPDLKADILEII